jgi:hypothetical protein
MLLKEVFDGFSVPLRSAISAHRHNLSKEDKNTSRETIPVMGVFMRGKFLAESKTYKTIPMTGKGNSLWASSLVLLGCGPSCKNVTSRLPESCSDACPTSKRPKEKLALTLR